MNRTVRWIGVGVVFVLSCGVAGVQAQQPVSAEPQAPSRAAQSPSELVPTLAVPRLIKLAGALKDAQGKPLSNTVGVTFAIYKEQQGGAALWLETQNVELDEQGHYSVLLGATRSEGLPLELFSSGEPRWLGVQVQLPGEVEAPRVLLVSVPYSLKAADADTLGGMPASAFVLAAPSSTASGTSVSGSTTPASGNSKTAGKTAASGKTAAPLAPVTANFIPVFLDSAGTLGSSVMAQSGSFIGVGTTNPAAALHVNGDTLLVTSGTTAQIQFSGALSSARFGQDGSGAFFASDTNGKAVRFYTNNGTLNEGLRITSDSNVGIGTPTPTAKLDVAGSNPSEILNVTQSGTGNGLAVTANSTSTGTEAVRAQVVAQNTLSFSTVGVHGITNSGGGRGVVGETTFSASGGIGVQGLSASDTGIGVSGIASAGGSTVGVQGEATAGPVSGNTIGVRGISASNFGTGVQGEATSTSGFGVGVHGLLFGTTGVAGLFSAGPNATLILGQSSGLNMFSVGGNGNVSLAGNLSLPATTNAPTGVILLGNQPFAHSFGTNNTFIGERAGNFAMTGTANAAFGTTALQSNTTGNQNSAFGANALNANTTGNQNSAFGSAALQHNNPTMPGEGVNNSAFGFQALNANTTGFANSAFGNSALLSNTTGGSNSAFGSLALDSNTTGGSNSAFGVSALRSNTTGFGNSAFGLGALLSNATGVNNAAFGDSALLNFGALGGTGDSNIAIGTSAGLNLAAGSSNIYLGSSGPAIFGGSESNTIRIGTAGTQTAAFMAGISGVNVGASSVPVVVTSSGQLGVNLSSRRFKDEIADMGGESDLLMKLRPVAFYYKPQYDDTHTRQYGLVAEEVAQVAPQLVVFDKEGAPQTVRYHFVNAMLLNEVQKQRRENEEQRATIAAQESKIHDLEARLSKLEAAVTGR